MRLHHSSIIGQLVPAKDFHATKFKTNWPYTTYSEIINNYLDINL